MAKKSVADASAELYKLLEPYTAEERARMVQGTLTLLGDATLATERSSQQSTQQQGSQQSNQQQNRAGGLDYSQARKYFNDKAVRGKIEELAASARFQETHGGPAALRKEDFKAVFDGARRSFIARNFSRDIDNAVRGGYFNPGGATAGYTLSHYGQDYIDALPDRAAAKAIRRPKRGGRGKAKRKKAAAKAAG